MNSDEEDMDQCSSDKTTVDLASCNNKTESVQNYLERNANESIKGHNDFSSDEKSLDTQNIKFSRATIVDSEHSDTEDQDSTVNKRIEIEKVKLVSDDGSSDDKSSDNEVDPGTLQNDDSLRKAKKNRNKFDKNELEVIHKETQRIVRESHISVPYHKPKQHSLAEFLQRRRSIPVVPLRTSVEHLNQVWKHLEEREKEAENFYKSESEHEDEVQEKQSDGGSNIMHAVNCDDGKKRMKYKNILGISETLGSQTDDDEEVNDLTKIHDKEDVLDESNKIVCQLNEGIPAECEMLVQNTKKGFENENCINGQNNTQKNSFVCLSENSTEQELHRENEKITSIKERHFCITELQDIVVDLSEKPTETTEVTKSICNIKGCKPEINILDSNPGSNEIMSSEIGNKSENGNNGKEHEWVKTVKENESVNKNRDHKIIPKLTGEQNGIINLDVGPKPGVSDLIQRFIKHTKFNKNKIGFKEPINLSVISAEHDENGQVTDIKEEVVSVLRTKKNEDADPKLCRPGAKLAKLKAELQVQMVQRRGQEWSKKQQEQELYEDEIVEDYKSELDLLDKELETNKNIDDDNDEEDDDEEESDEEGDNGDDDEEDEEEDCKRKLIKIKKNEFLDEEAEVSEDGGEIEAADDDEDEDDEGMIPPYQVRNYDKEEDTNSVCDEENSTLLSQSPALCLTALEGKDLNRSINFEDSPVKQICFTPFKDRKPSVSGIHCLMDSPLQTQGPQELMGLCSGQFQTQPLRCSMLEVNDEELNTSQDFSLVWSEDSQQQECKQKPFTPLVQTSEGTAEWKSTLVKFTSDDEDTQEFKITKNKRRKLNFSDDEDEGDKGEDGKEETEDWEDKKSDNGDEMKVENGEAVMGKRYREDESNDKYKDNESEDDTRRELEYDSEENEVQYDGGNFLDVEAELSESDWDSADEDEHDLDNMEQEEADKEEIDEESLKEELEKIHMRRMLVEDKKEVRLLQEMLLEDGDLHSDGGGRKRLFRWSNNDFGEEGTHKLDGDSDEEKDDDEEDELAWRRFRHEREMYLLEHKKKIEFLEAEKDEEDDSRVLKLGRAALKRINSNSQPLKPSPPVDLHNSSAVKHQLFQVRSRGSFLSRGQQVLARLAQITTVSETSTAQLLQPKHSRNFVFATLSPTKKDEPRPQTTKVMKRKTGTASLPPPLAKRPCISHIDKHVKKGNSLLEQLAKCES